MTSARDFTVRLADLLRKERADLAEFLAALADFDRRRLWIALGHSSLFYFLHRELGLSKGAAFYRKTAAELIQKYPEILEPLREGKLCLTSVVELSKVLTPENRDEVLPRFFQLSKREAKEVSAALRPDEAAPRREVVTAVRVPPAAPALALAAAREPDLAHSVHPANRPPVSFDATAADPAPATLPSSPSRAAAAIEPLTANASRLHVTVSRRFLEKLEAARAALSHSHPGASADEILEAGLELILEMDADFSHDPARLPALLAAARDADLALGSRYVRGGGCIDWGLGRRLLSRGGSLYARAILGVRVRDLTGGFKCFRRRVLEAIELETVECSGYAFQIELTYRALVRGFRVVEVPIVFADRRVGRSKMSGRIVVEAIWKVWAMRFSRFARSMAPPRR